MINYLDMLTAAQRAKTIEYYSADFRFSPGLAAGATDDPTFTIGDADFVFTDITGSARDPANPTVLFLAPAITVQINDEGSGRNLFNRPQDWHSRVGSAERAYILPMPFMVKQTSVVTATLVNIALAGGQAYDVRLTIGGFKIFPTKRGG